jgi:hypothetical protein
MKKRFPILKKQLEYTYATQVQLVNALCCLHNFIRMEGGQNDDFDVMNEEEMEEQRLSNIEISDTTPFKHKDVTEKEKQEAKSERDRIAEAMWDQFIKRS